MTDVFKPDTTTANDALVIQGPKVATDALFTGPNEYSRDAGSDTPNTNDARPAGTSDCKGGALRNINVGRAVSTVQT